MKPTKLLRWTVLASVSAMAVACGGGISTLGSGDEDPMAKAGSSSAGTGGGKGEVDPGTGATTSMGGNETGVGAGPGVEPCMSDQDCKRALLPCEPCADGSYACNQTYCDAGKCVRTRDRCQVECEVDMDCPVRDLACLDCGDGTQACDTAQCIMGSCQNSFGTCSGSEYCKGQECGTPCMALTDQGGMGAAPLASYCNGYGQCQAGQPQCAGECNTAMDCGTPPPECKMCPGGTCAQMECLGGQCVYGCAQDPEPQPECESVMDCPIIGDSCTLCPVTMQCAVQACLSNKCELVCPID